MDTFLDLLRQNIEATETIGDKIENGEYYMDDIRQYLPDLSQILTDIFQLLQKPEIQLELNQEFVMQVLNDILYGIENNDAVFLLDVLRYGLLDIYYYIETELKREEA